MYGDVEKKKVANSFCHTHVNSVHNKSWREMTILSGVIMFRRIRVQRCTTETELTVDSHHQIILMRSQTKWPWEQWNRFIWNEWQWWKLEYHHLHSYSPILFGVEVLVRVCRVKMNKLFFQERCSFWKWKKKEKNGHIVLWCVTKKKKSPIEWANQLEFVAQVSDYVVKCG